MICYIKKKIKEFLTYRKIIKLNKNIFKKSKKINDQIFLIEFNAFHNFHIAVSVFSNFFKKKKNCEVHAFFNYSLLSAPLKFNFINEIKWKLGNLFLIRNFNIYKSFGVKKIFKPEINKKIEIQSIEYFKKIFYKIKNKNEVLDIKIKNILIGDLLYDTFLKSRVKPTIEIKSKEFKNFFLDFIKLFLFWHDYIDKNKINGVITSHGVYSYALVLRIADKKKIPCYIINTNVLSKFKTENYGASIYGEHKNYRKKFKHLNFHLKKNGIKKAKKILDQKLNGKVGSQVYLEHADISSFSKPKKNIRYLEKNKKFKVLISTHDFFDSVHFYGKNFYSDFYEWLWGLSEIAKKTNFDWYIKNHPSYGGRYKIYQRFTDEVVKNFVKKNTNIKLLPNNTSNKQLINEGIQAVLTVYGSVAAEFPYFGVPVINACKNNLHDSYNFSISPKSKREYEDIIKKLPEIKVCKNYKKELTEFHFMRHILIDKNWIFENYDKMIEEIGGYHNLQSINFYSYWLKYYKKSKINRAEKNIEEFLNSKNQVLEIKQ